MGASWIWLDSDKEVKLVEGKLGFSSWPSSTKAELVAIWLAILIVPKEVDIVINTDSVAAIASLDKELQLEAFNQ